MINAHLVQWVFISMAILTSLWIEDTIYNILISILLLLIGFVIALIMIIKENKDEKV